VSCCLLHGLYARQANLPRPLAPARFIRFGGTLWAGILGPGAGEGTSYILVVESTFDETVARGETPQGLRAPEGPEEVTGTPVFSWVDDSGEDRYHIDVFDTFGEIIWSDTNVPGSSGSDPEVTYAGPALQSKMFYQFRVTSFDGNDRPLSRTEDLKGVFFLP
jgi:hypothetical protein